MSKNKFIIDNNNKSLIFTISKNKINNITQIKTAGAIFDNCKFTNSGNFSCVDTNIDFELLSNSNAKFINYESIQSITLKDNSTATIENHYCEQNLTQITLKGTSALKITNANLPIGNLRIKDKAVLEIEYNNTTYKIPASVDTKKIKNIYSILDTIDELNIEENNDNYVNKNTYKIYTEHKSLINHIAENSDIALYKIVEEKNNYNIISTNSDDIISFTNNNIDDIETQINGNNSDYNE